MKAKLYPLLILVMGLINGLQAQSKDTLRFNENMFFDEGHSLEAYAGSVIELGPGVLLVIEGSLCLEGTAEKPIKVINQDPENPGVGIQIQAQNHDASVKIRHVEFQNLTQSLRFDPFWYRKEIVLEGLSFQGSTSGEPVLYLGDPYIDRRWGRSIDLKIHDLLFVNNSGGMVVEAYGSPLVHYDFSDLHFRDNYFEGPEQALIHFDLYPDERNPSPISSLVFDRNQFEEEDYLISVGGNFDQSLHIDTLVKSGTAGILDNRIDHRLPQLKVDFKRAPKNEELTDFTIVEHKQDSISMIIKNIGQKNLNLKVLDLEGNSLSYKMLRQEDKTWLIYTEGPAQFVELADGYRIVLPKPEELNPIDTAKPEELYAEESSEETEEAELREASQLGALGDQISEFLNRKTSPLNRWEFGTWGGGALYGAGDIKPKFTLVDNLVYFPSTVDISFGVYAQYNFNSRFAAKASYYNSTISMHDFSAAGFFSGTAPLMGYNEEFEPVEISETSYPASFITNINSLEFEGIWHLRQYQLNPNQRSKLIPSIGLNFGTIQFTPQRTKYTTRLEDDNYFSYLSRAKERRINLRDLGSEGQNFLPGAEPYSQLALTGGMSFSMTWLFQNFALKGEIKGVYTSTDYLDDFGPGLWYGGNRDAVIDNAQVDPNLTRGEVASYVQNVDLPQPGIQRSTDGLNDWYFQGHLGFSIFLDSFRKKK